MVPQEHLSEPLKLQIKGEAKVPIYP